MAYTVERVPMPTRLPGRVNPLTRVVAGLKAGESVKVEGSDPNWRATMVANMNQSHKPKHWFATREGDGWRVFRDR